MLLDEDVDDALCRHSEGRQGQHAILHTEGQTLHNKLTGLLQHSNLRAREGRKAREVRGVREVREVREVIVLRGGVGVSGRAHV